MASVIAIYHRNQSHTTHLFVGRYDIDIFAYQWHAGADGAGDIVINNRPDIIGFHSGGWRAVVIGEMTIGGVSFARLCYHDTYHASLTAF